MLSVIHVTPFNKSQPPPQVFIVTMKFSRVSMTFVLANCIVLNMFHLGMACEDIEGRFAVTFIPSLIGQNKKCQWVARSATEQKCTYDEVKEACPDTCGLCSTENDSTINTCIDSAERFYLTGLGANKDCDWAATKSTASRCEYSEILANCPVTCGVCEQPSPAPSPSPTIHVTSCQDTAEKFYLDEVTQWKQCSWTANNVVDRCAFGGVADNCPRTCGQCADEPSAAPSLTSLPTMQPTTKPSPSPTASPTKSPSAKPSHSPTSAPSRSPSKSPTTKPSVSPTSKPSTKPSNKPSFQPSAHRTRPPSPMPSPFPRLEPSSEPSKIPSDEPSRSPSSEPSRIPSTSPSDVPSREPSSTRQV